ncbi:AIPR family protein [Nocardioides sp. SYSU DS0651]|uniref:AIPR family protein n=1 Tax=Nocardioides sp. SYSU DS0651 TaxID=3415955 RepID=UPI003F4B7742
MSESPVDGQSAKAETPAPATRKPLAEGAGWSALSEREDLAKYGEGNSIALFAAELRLGIDDIETFAADALTDHGNDKKCDLVAVLRDSGQLVIAQTYAAKDPGSKSEGPAGKASDLNTAVSWLLSGPLEGLPEILRDAAIEARDALSAGDITDVQIWSVHNCPEGKNIQTELQQAAKTANSLLSQYFTEAQVNVSCTEIGRDAINDLYRRTQLPILVDEELTFDIAGGFETSGEDWRAYNTAIRLSDLRSLWKTHGTDLMSPNIRDYLGVRRSERNINYGIKVTAKENPQDFFIYNNGITAMVHGFEPSKDSTSLTVKGMGIVNGGQTTGSIGTLSDGEAGKLDDARVQIRFVTSTDYEVLENVVRYNNTQNKVEATDFRSKDAVQDRLRSEFEAIPEALYRGARRGGADDAIKRDRTLLSDSAVAQSVASFHGNPNLAYNELRQIWEHDPTYARFFNDNLHARHVVFCYSLLKAVEEAKLNLNSISDEKRTKTQKGHAEFFRSRGGVHLLTAAIGSSIETVLDEAVPDRFSLRFKTNVSPAKAIDLWRPIVQSGLPFTGQLSGATNLGLKSTERVEEAMRLFESMIEATRDSKQDVFDDFATKVEQSTT